ncbi:MAG TPA: hypothetical protein VH572_06935 [Gaiella sp.]|jgi:hypothetical protein
MTEPARHGNTSLPDGERDVPPSDDAQSLEETVARGREAKTPFALLGGVAAVLWTAVGIVSAAALLIWWLA